jgi:hypothetical protein
VGSRLKTVDRAGFVIKLKDNTPINGRRIYGETDDFFYYTDLDGIGHAIRKDNVDTIDQKRQESIRDIKKRLKKDEKE